MSSTLVRCSLPSSVSMPVPSGEPALIGPVRTELSAHQVRPSPPAFAGPGGAPTAPFSSSHQCPVGDDLCDRVLLHRPAQLVQVDDNPRAAVGAFGPDEQGADRLTKCPATGPAQRTVTASPLVVPGRADPGAPGQQLTTGIWCCALWAVMNSATDTGPSPRSPEGARLFEDVSLHQQLGDFPAQPAQLGPLILTQRHRAIGLFLTTPLPIGQLPSMPSLIPRCRPSRPSFWSPAGPGRVRRPVSGFRTYRRLPGGRRAANTS